MKEKYYLKSISRTIKKDKIQPLIIIFVLIIAFLVMNTSYSITNAFKNDDKIKAESTYGKSDIIISTNSNSGSRFLIKEEIENTLENVTISGSFTVPFLKEDNLISSIAIDFETANQFFEFNFISYSSFNIVDKANVIFISDKFSKEYNLNLNDTLNLSLFGKEKEYIVKGINKCKMIGENDIVIDITSIINSLKDVSSYLSLFTNDFKIYNKVYIKSLDDNIDDKIEILNNKYQDYSIEKIDNDYVRNDANISNAISFVMGFLLFSQTFTIILITTYCINKKRKELSSLFYLVGYTKKKITLYRIIEMIIYALIGYIIGTSLSILFSILSFKLIGFEYVDYHFNFVSSILYFFILSICSILPILFTIKDKEHVNKNKAFNKIWLVFPILLLILTIAILLVKGNIKFKFGISIMAIVFVTVFIFTKPLLVKICKILSNNTKNVYKRLAYLNTIKIGEIVNIAKLVSLLVSFMFVGLLFVASSVSTYIEKDYYFDADLAITSVNNDCLNKIRSIDGVESVYSFYSNSNSVIDNRSAIIWGTDNISVFGPLINYETIPKNNELFTSESYATKYNIKLNDKVKIKIDNDYKEFVVTRIEKGVEYNFLINPEYNNLKYNVYYINLSENANIEEMYSLITSIISPEMGTIIKTNDLIKEIYERQKMYIYFVLLVVSILLVFSVISVINNVSENNRSRKQEIEYYSLSGMSEIGIKKVKKYENKITILFSIILTIFTSIFLTIASNEALKAYAADIIQSIKALFYI